MSSKLKLIRTRKHKKLKVRIPRVPFSGTKVRYQVVPNTMYSHKWNNGPPSNDTLNRVGGAWNAYVSTFTGTSNPAWKSQIKQGVSATTNCSGTRRLYDPSYFNAAWQGRLAAPPHGLLGQEDYGYPPLSGLFGSDGVNAPASMVTNVTNRAIVKFLDRAESARSSFEAGQDLGEFRETIRGIMHPLKSLREFTLSHLSRVLKLSKQVQHKKALSKMVADTWLEYRFGWRPLALDISQGYADLMNNHHFDQIPVRATAHDTFPVVVTTSSNMPLINGAYSCPVTSRVTGEFFVTYKGSVRTNAVNGQIGLRQNLQLDLPHLVPTIWDLLPYSWIADYFANVGDIVRSLCFGSGNVAWLNKTVRTVINYDYSFGQLKLNFVPTATTISVDQPSGTPSATFVSFTRTAVSPDTLVPRFQFTIPLTDRPWENMAALMAGRQKEISRVAKHLRK